MTDLAGSLVTSSRPQGRPQKRPDDRTSNAGVAVRTADGSRRTAAAADEQCLRCGCRLSSANHAALFLQSNADHNKSVFSFLRQLSTRHCSHLLLCAVLRRRCCWAFGGRRCRSIFPAATALSSKPAAAAYGGQIVGRTDRQTDVRHFYRSCSAYYARSINNYRVYTFVAWFTFVAS